MYYTSYLLTFRRSYWNPPVRRGVCCRRYARWQQQLPDCRVTVGGYQETEGNIPIYGKCEMWAWKLVAGKRNKIRLTPASGVCPEMSKVGRAEKI